MMKSADRDFWISGTMGFACESIQVVQIGSMADYYCSYLAVFTSVGQVQEVLRSKMLVSKF